MGLTHYWRRPPALRVPVFAWAADDCRKMMPLIGVALADGQGPATFNQELIRFNGAGAQRCETFLVRQAEIDLRHRPTVFSFCKTHGLPYDLCVRAALIILRHHLGNAIGVFSDDADWNDACALCQEHLGYGRQFRLDP